MSASMADYEGDLTTLGFLRADGPVNPSGPTAKDVSQVGVAGLALQRTGYVGNPFVVVTLAAFGSANDLALAQILHMQYRTRRVTITDDFGNPWGNLWVKDVNISDARRVWCGVGALAGKSHILITTWTIQSGAIQYP